MPGVAGMVGEALWRGLTGQEEAVPTRQGEVTFRRGGLPGLLAGRAGGTAYFPGLGAIASSDAPAISEESAIHEGRGHEEGRGALYDLWQRVKGDGTPKGLDSAKWSPSEVYAYSTQPAELSQDDMRNYYRVFFRDRPELLEYFNKHRNPESDWPTTAEEWAALAPK